MRKIPEEAVGQPAEKEPDFGMVLDCPDASVLDSPEPTFEPEPKIQVIQEPKEKPVLARQVVDTIVDDLYNSKFVLPISVSILLLISVSCIVSIIRAFK